MVKALLVTMAVVGVCLPQSVLAATGAPVVVDVALAQGNALSGQVVDPQGLAINRAAVSLRQGDREIVRAKTDLRGRFTFPGLRGGTYQIVAAKGHGTCRVWAPGTAPPLASVVGEGGAGDDTVRGQCSVEKNTFAAAARKAKSGLLSNPMVLGGIAATAVAIPIAIHRSQTPSSP